MTDTKTLFTDYRGRALPDAVDVEVESNETLFGAVKLAIKRCREQGVLPENAAYKDIAGDELALGRFIAALDKDRAIIADLMVNKEGKPVESDHDPLFCDLSLAQVERALVNECAKRVYAREARKFPNEERPIPGAPPQDAREVLGFGWQLALLTDYARLLTDDHFRILGPAILRIAKSEGLRTLSEMDLDVLAAGAKVAGPLAPDACAVDPGAFRGLAILKNPGELPHYVQHAGPAAWAFFAGDEPVIVEMQGVSREYREALGPVIADVGVKSLAMLQDLTPMTLRPFIASFKKKFGVDAREVLSDDQFVPDFLREIVTTYRELERGSDIDNVLAMVNQTAPLKWTSLHPKVMKWLKARRKERAAEEA